MTNRAMQRLVYVHKNVVSLIGVAVFIVYGTVTISQVTADEGRNQLPKKQHKDSEAPFLTPEEAVSRMGIPDGFEVSVL